jgi:hypothetical protein
LTDGEQEKLGRRPTENAEAYEEFCAGAIISVDLSSAPSVEDCEAAIKISNAPSSLTRISRSRTAVWARVTPTVFSREWATPEDYTYAEAAFSKAFFYDPNVRRSARFDGFDLSFARRKEKSAG